MSTFDFHVHCFPEFLAKRAIALMAFVTSSQTDGTWDEQLQYMGRHDVVHCVGLNMATTPHSMRKVNQFAVNSVRPDQLVFGSVHPMAENALEELAWLYEQGIRGIKLHTGYQHFLFDDPKFFPIYRRIGELGMATIIHSGTFFDDKEYLVWPSTVARAIDQFQGAPFVCAHMGGVTSDDPEFSILKELPVYVDTAGASHLMTQEQFVQAVRELGNHRVLFGTDMPWENPEILIRWMNPAIASCPDIDPKAIYYDNAMALCRRFVPELWDQWRREDDVHSNRDAAMPQNTGLTWYKVFEEKKEM